MFDIYNRILDLCTDKDINTLYELSKICNIPQSTLRNIKNGHSARVDTIEKICEGLNITLTDFFCPLDNELIDPSFILKNKDLLETAQLLLKLPKKTQKEIFAYIKFKESYND